MKNLQKFHFCYIYTIKNIFVIKNIIHKYLEKGFIFLPIVELSSINNQNN